MKAFYLVAFVLLGKLVAAQTPFQGTIVYKLHASKEKEDGELTLKFGVNKVKVQFKEKAEYDKSYLLIDLDSGKLFTVNTNEKTFSSKKLEIIDPANDKLPESKNIAGYATSPVHLDRGGYAGVLTGIFSGQTTLFTANDLYYSAPQKYLNAPELIFIHDNHIVLGAEIRLPGSMADEEEPSLEKEFVFITVEAKSVTKTIFNTNDFLIPKDYTKASRYNFSMDSTAMVDSVMMDTSMVYADSTAVAPKKPVKPKPKTQPTAPKKKTTTKGEAIKPKKN